MGKILWNLFRRVEGRGEHNNDQERFIRIYRRLNGLEQVPLSE